MDQIVSRQKDNNPHRKLRFSSVAAMLSLSCFSAIPASAQDISYYSCLPETTKGCQPLDTLDQKTTYTKTQYPLILTHGAGGFGPLYHPNTGSYYQIPEELAAGGTLVFETTAPAFNSSEVRGEYVYVQVQYAKAIAGTDKVNLLGHSHGGQDVRYIAGTYPDEVASVTTVATANKGSGFAEFLSFARVNINNINTSGWVTNSLAKVVNAWGNMFSHVFDVELPQDAFASLESLDYAGMADFNQRFPHGVPADCQTQLPPQADNGIYYYSWTGNRIWTNLLDPTDYAMATTGAFIKGPNDGLIPQCSSHLGYVIRDNYYLNHFDAVNILFGLRSWRSPNPVTLFKSHVNRLKNQGL